MIGRDSLSKAETVMVAAIEGGVPTLVEAREVIAAFHAIIRRKAGTDIAAWIDHARKSLVASFANGIAKDEAAAVKHGEGVARVGAKVPVKVGDKLTFAVSIEDMKFFDEATGLAIRG